MNLFKSAEPKTLRIKFLTSIASERWSFDPGQIADVPEAEARTHILTGRAELATGQELARGLSVCAYGHEEFQDWCKFCYVTF